MRDNLMARRNGRDSVPVFDMDTKLEIGSAMPHYAKNG
jgi:hypothetical protein